MGIIDEIYEGKLDLSVPPEQLVLENDLVELLPCLPEKSDREAWVELCIDQGKTVGMILQQMLKLKADDEFNISKLMGALDNEDGMHLSIEESVVGEIEKDSSFCFDPSDDAVIDEKISQWVSESVWPPILNRFKLDRSEFIRKLVGEIGKSLDCDPPSAAGWCDFSMIDFAAAEFMDESLGSGVSVSHPNIHCSYAIV
ncbi:hypothetical protein ANOM_005761 [Aspergillus nomiae NRRL 13137]|uniref:Uncharacterized protein n=1 Tax=Aspergillus nomiae NRRL (strain ATCC 15546 / NRRL 13137 / CBS 260.88 / M93) TaxID=1509407 RepID=A0A0L1IZI3_ASPN3|nr:uncharacterized protein ANOM_005761 [Aspergillus nomiae NRRL 13137]KNG84946.1 hypothetical protein ANOM_005761 [Aspergillus nomiae NRRL 13137]